MQLRAYLSPAGVHAEVAEVQNLPSRKTASSSRASPVAIGLLEPRCFALGGSVRMLIVKSVVVTWVPPRTPGTPISDHRVILVSSADAMNSVEVDERLFAGMIGRFVKSLGGPKKSVCTLVLPASSSLLFQTTNSLPC